ncbi:MAG: hypothetical protein Q8L04_09340 [Ignavibacteria bacterium]|nr:hypothetical protein [Ignavibacteria bacterium]
MKSIKNHLFAINIAVLLLISAGCKEYTTKTKINSDGSCERIVIVEGDTSNIAGLPFPIPIDKSWKIEKKKSEKDSTKVAYSAEKRFTDVNDLNAEYKDQSKIGVKINFEKKFRWFYTYYEYEETYKSYFPFKLIPLKEYLTKEEYQEFLDGDTTKTFKDKLDEYAGRNYVEYFLSEFLKACKKHNITDVSQASIVANKQLILEQIDKQGEDIDKLIQFLEKTLRSKSLKVVKPEIELLIEDIEKKMEWAGSADGTYTNQVSLPGVILSTNSKSVKGNTVEWKVDSWRFQFEDLAMRVESRSANVSMFVVTGVVFVLALILLLLPKFKKRNLLGKA